MPSSYFHLTTSLALTGATTLVLGLFVLWRKRRERLGLVFFCWCLSIAWWSLLELLIITRTDAPSALFWGRVTQAGDIFLPTLFVHFVITFLGLSVRPWKLIALYAASAMLALLSFSPAMIPSATPRTDVPYFITAGPYYWVMVVYFTICVLFAQGKLFSAYRSASGQNRAKLGYFFWSSVAGFVGGCMNFLLVFEVDSPILYSYGTYTVPLFVAATAYAIVRHRLMDITVVVHKWLAYLLLLAIILIPASIAVIVSHRVTLLALPPLLTGALVFACGLWVILKHPGSAIPRTFALVCGGVCCWLFGAFMLYSSADAETAGFWSAVGYAGVVYIPTFFYHFSVSLLQLREQRRALWTLYLASTVFLLMLPSSYLLDGLHRYSWGFYPKAGVLHSVFLAYFATVSGRSLWLLHQAARTATVSSPLSATRLRNMFWAFAAGYLASADFLPIYGIDFYPAGYLFVCLWTALVTHSILKYQLVDSSPETTEWRILPYRQFLALVPVYLIILFLLRAFTGSAHYVLAGVLVATFAIFSEFLANLQHRVERAVEKALFTRRYDAYETLTEFSKAMVTILDLKTLNQEIVQTLAKVMGIETASIYLLDKEKDVYELKATYGASAVRPSPEQFKSGHALPQLLRLAGHPVIREELTHGLASPVEDAAMLSDAADALGLIGAESGIPLLNKDRLIGFLNLGPKSRSGMYSQEDLNLLSTLAHNAAIALDNALLYEDLRRQKAIMQRTDRLRSLETIAGGFAHEIRNPLTSIKTFVQLAPERRNDPEFIEHFSAVVAEDVDRIERLIQEILDYARYMEPKLNVQDLNEVVASCLYFIEVKAATKDIVIQRHLAADLPPVMLDRQQIKQVLLNLFLNALDAMGDRGGRLTVRTHRLTKRNGDEWVQVEVADTGSGIAPENLEHIFDPFYTTKHESGEREGTGLGLTIVHQIVQEHRGYIEVESAVGRGTTFYVNLPTNPLQAGQVRGGEAHEKTGSLDR